MMQGVRFGEQHHRHSMRLEGISRLEGRRLRLQYLVGSGLSAEQNCKESEAVTHF